MKATELEKIFLEENLANLVKLGLLILENDAYKFNENFSSRKIRVECQLLIPFKEVEKKQLENEREMAVEAAIVKIMKKQKVLTLMELLMEVQHYLKSFNPTTK
jgi:hypothetical protein